jgi:hypothetical protein
MDPNFTGSVLNALPLDKMIGGPLQAMIKAQVQASKAYADFLLQVCIKDGKAVSVQFDYDETIVNEKGEYQGTMQKTMRIPLLAAISHPNICIEEGTIDFEMEISQSEESNTSTEMEASLEASVGWGPFKVTIKGRASHKSAQTRKSDTRAKYTIHTAIKRQDPPEALMRVIEFLTDSATKPVQLPNSQLENTKALPSGNNILTSPAEEQKVEQSKKK